MKGYVSGYNFDPAVRKGLELPDSVGVFDTTLRDGEQTPGVSLLPEEKEAIAEQLSRLGVAVIEAGFPINSAQEKAIVRRIAGMGLEAEVCALARVKPGDLQACFDCNPDVVHAFISTSDIHIRDQMPGYTRERVREEAVRAVEMVKDAGFKCMYSPMDATRTELPYLVEVCRAVEEAGVDIINLP
ncbi:MAG: 2-isopropylmalate synthase, partial [Candidatus ainarchaeum sp.]|nr:2-isopropylmalate synthase [Candidatus ainarchaeum sp.]